MSIYLDKKVVQILQTNVVMRNASLITLKNQYLETWFGICSERKYM